MFNRKDAAVTLAVCSLLASVGMAQAEKATVPSLTLDQSVVNLQDAAPQGLLMTGLDRVGAARPLQDLGINVYGWVEAGYTLNHRNHSPVGTEQRVSLRPFTTGYRNAVAGNQLVLRVERQVDMKKFDVGGTVELMYGTDAGAIHANGLQWNGVDESADATPADSTPPGRFHPTYQFDVPQAFVDVAVPLGNGWKFRVGKFYTLLSYEYVQPDLNPFYSRSLLFTQVPFTQTGILAFYPLNDQWGVTAGITRGWDQATEDNNNDAIDFLGKVEYTPNKDLAMALVASVGPQNPDDTAHYRTALDLTGTYKVTDRLSVGAEGLWIYDGGRDIDPDGSRTYSDAYGAALYAGYVINEYVTANARGEVLHTYGAFVQGDNTNLYEITLGVTIKPMPRDQYFSSLLVRPEVRYDFSDQEAYQAGSEIFKEQLTFGVDVILKF